MSNVDKSDAELMEGFHATNEVDAAIREEQVVAALEGIQKELHYHHRAMEAYRLEEMQILRRQEEARVEMMTIHRESSAQNREHVVRLKRENELAAQDRQTWEEDRALASQTAEKTLEALSVMVDYIKRLAPQVKTTATDEAQ